MERKFKKFFGWILCFGGISIILWTLYSSYNIFTNKIPPPEIFKEEQKPTPSKKVQGIQGIEAQMEEKLKEIMAEQFKGMLPVDSLPKLLNLISWSILAGVLILGASQLAHIGIKMIG